MELRKFRTSAGANGGVKERIGLPDSIERKRRSSRTGSPVRIMSKEKRQTGRNNKVKITKKILIIRLPYNL
jgi:hypothetical protein